MLHRIRFSTFLFIVCFFLLPAWAIASQITSAATRENERVSFEGQTTLGEALTRLLNLTGEQVFFLWTGRINKRHRDLPRSSE